MIHCDISVHFQETEKGTMRKSTGKYEDFEIDGTTLIKYIGKEEIVYVPYGIAIIASGAFSSWDTDVKEKRVVLPDTVRIIKSHAFTSGTIEEINFEEGLEIIEDHAFIQPALLSISIPSTLRSIHNAFIGHQLTEIILSPNNKHFEYRGNSIINLDNKMIELVFGNAQILGDDILSYSENLFCNNRSVREVVIHPSIKTIPKQCFSGSSIESVNIPEGVEKIEHDAFSDCDNLKEIYIPNSVAQIERAAFVSNSVLAKIHCGAYSKPERWDLFWNKNPSEETDDVWTKSVGTQVVWGTVRPGTTQTLADFKFANSSKKTVTGYDGYVEILRLPNISTSIDKGAFFDHDEIKKIVIGDNIKSIGDYAFKNCRNVEEIEFSESVTHIGKNAFEGCTKLKSIIFPNSLKVIDDNAFLDCDALLEIVASGKLNHIGDSAFKNCTRLMRVLLPDCLKIIGDSAFENCLSLSVIDLPSQLRYIGHVAFKKTDLVGLEIPCKVKFVGTSAFAYCKRLNKIAILYDTPQSRKRVENHTGESGWN